jgi:hypothetical protein
MRKTKEPQAPIGSEWWAVLVVGARCNPTNRWLAVDAATTQHDAVGISPEKAVKSGSQPARVALWRSRAGARAEIRAGDRAYGRADGAEVIRMWKNKVKQPKGDASHG